MLLLFLIGAALSHARPEPQSESGLPPDPLRSHRERWRCITGAAAVLEAAVPPITLYWIGKPVTARAFTSKEAVSEVHQIAKKAAYQRVAS